MNPLAKKLALVLYFAISGAIFVNYFMGLRWFGAYDKIIMWGFVAVAAIAGNWLKSRAERKADSGEVVVEALGFDGAVRSDPKTYRFVQQVVVGAAGVSALIFLATIYKDHRQQQFGIYALTLVVVIVIFAWVFWTRFGNISEVESDDRVTLALRLRGQTTRVPWSQVESVEVSRPYAFWQVTVKYRLLGESKVEVARFLPLGWRKMTPAVAEKLRAALDARRVTE